MPAARAVRRQRSPGAAFSPETNCGGERQVEGGICDRVKTSVPLCVMKSQTSRPYPVLSFDFAITGHRLLWLGTWVKIIVINIKHKHFSCKHTADLHWAARHVSRGREVTWSLFRRYFLYLMEDKTKRNKTEPQKHHHPPRQTKGKNKQTNTPTGKQTKPKLKQPTPPHTHLNKSSTRTKPSPKRNRKNPNHTKPTNETHSLLRQIYSKELLKLPCCWRRPAVGVLPGRLTSMLG